MKMALRLLIFFFITQIIITATAIAQNGRAAFAPSTSTGTSNLSAISAPTAIADENTVRQLYSRAREEMALATKNNGNGAYGALVLLGDLRRKNIQKNIAIENSIENIFQGLVEELHSTSDPVRRGVIVAALGSIGSPNEIKVLFPLLTDKASRVSAEAYMALERRRDIQSVNKIRDLVLLQNDLATTTKALLLLEKINTGGSHAAMIAISNQHKNADVRVLAIKILARMPKSYRFEDRKNKTP